jgi:hypothetical protein
LTSGRMPERNFSVFPLHSRTQRRAQGTESRLPIWSIRARAAAATSAAAGWHARFDG